MISVSKFCMSNPVFASALIGAVFDTELSMFHVLDVSPLFEFYPRVEEKSISQKMIQSCIDFTLYLYEGCYDKAIWLKKNCFFLITFTYEKSNFFLKENLFNAGTYAYAKSFNISKKIWIYGGGEQLMHFLTSCSQLGGGVMASGMNKIYESAETVTDFAFEKYKPHSNYQHVIEPKKNYKFSVHPDAILVPLDLKKALDKTKLMAIDLVYDKVKYVCDKHPWEASAIVTASSAVIFFFGVPLLPIILINPSYFALANAIITVSLPLVCSSDSLLPELVPIPINEVEVVPIDRLEELNPINRIEVVPIKTIELIPIPTDKIEVDPDIP